MVLLIFARTVYNLNEAQHHILLIAKPSQFAYIAKLFSLLHEVFVIPPTLSYLGGEGSEGGWETPHWLVSCAHKRTLVPSLCLVILCPAKIIAIITLWQSLSSPASDSKSSFHWSAILLATQNIINADWLENILQYQVQNQTWSVHYNYDTSCVLVLSSRHNTIW